MSTTVVVIKDHVQSIAMTLIYGQQHKETVLGRFDEEDALLSRLQANPAFTGYMRLAQLDPGQYRTLINLHLSLLADISPEKRRIPGHPLMRSLDILFIGLLISLERRLQGSIALMHVNRSGETVVYDVHATLDEYELPKPKPPKGLRVIVDNE